MVEKDEAVVNDEAAVNDEAVVKDEVVVRQILKGDTRQYETLVKKYQNKIYQLAYRMTRSHDDALDITQDSLIKAFNSLEMFRNQSSFYTWLYRIASNKTLDFIRKQKRVKKRDEHVVNEYLTEASATGEKQNPELKYLKKENQALVQKAINSLPEKYSMALILNHYHELSYQEIAEVLELPVKTVGTRIYRARALLKEIILKGGREREV